MTFGDLINRVHKRSDPANANGSTKLDDAEKTSKSSQPPPVSNQQAAELIDSLGESVTELELRLYGDFDFSLAFVKSVWRLKHLKVLKIISSFTGGGLVRYVCDRLKELGACAESRVGRSQLPDTELARLDQHEPKELAALLDATPGLECLIIKDHQLKPMKFASRTLSNLRYFYFEYSEANAEGITRIFEQAKDTLKVIEYSSTNGECLEFRPAFEAIRSNLEGIFVSSTVSLPRYLWKTEFPRLRVLRADRGTTALRKGDFPDWPMLRTIRTLVMDLQCANDCYDFDGHLPNLKQLFFHNYFGGETLDEKLIEHFELRGVKCHLITEVEVDNIMELDLELDGPMD